MLASIQTFSTRREGCPPNRIVVGTDGFVQLYTQWTVWDNEPWNAVILSRREAGFRLQMSTPGGGGETVGSLDEVAKKFHPTVAPKVIQLFTLKNPTKTQITELGFL